MAWTRNEFKEAVSAILGAETYRRGFVAAMRESDVSEQCKAVATALFLGEAEGGTEEQLTIVRETMRRLHRTDGTHGLS